LGYALGVLLVAGFGVILLSSIFGDGLTRLSYDAPFILQNQRPDELVMVYFDASVKDRLHQPKDQPLGRRFFAQLVDRLQKGGARLVFIDVLFDTPSSNPESDEAFARAMREHGRVVLVAESVKELQGNSFAETTIPPTPVLKDAAAGYGLGNVNQDQNDYSVRELGTGSDNSPSASWVAAGLLGATKALSDRLKTRWLNYYCPSDSFQRVNLDQVLEPEGLPAGYFREKLVVVGARPQVHVAGDQKALSQEEFGNPYSSFGGARSPGAVVHALSLLNLLHGDWLRRLTLAQELMVVSAWGLLISGLLMRLPPWPAIGVAVLSSAIFGGVAAYLQLRHHVWFAWAVPALAQTPLALVWAVGYRYLIESRRRRKLRRAFAAYASPYMADQIANSDFDPAPGGKVVEATIMFTDLEGFTNMSEGLLPSELSRILISYFSLTTRAIFEQDGIVIKFIGDAVMAAWGAPVPDQNHAERSVLAAWGMYQAGQREIEGRRFRTRFGINTGAVLAGNLGSDVRFDFTLIGDATNVAQRLESLNKYFGTDILISESTRSRVSRRIQVRNLGQFIVAGRSTPIEVYEVLGVDVADATPPEWLNIFSLARQNFVSGDFTRAASLFHEVIRLRGKDGPSQFFLERIPELETDSRAGQAWNGMIRLEAK